MSLTVRRTQAAPWLKDALWRRAQAVPSLDLRFADNKSLTDSVSGQNLVTFSRASSATFVGSDGVLRTAVTNEPRFDHNPLTGESLGLLVEEPRTNSIRNNTMVGAVAGTPGTLPTNWGATVQGGLTRSIVEIGTENGITYADIRINGTANATGVVQIQFDVGGAGVGPAASGQTWTAAFSSKVVAGSAANITVFNNLIFGQNATNFVESASGSTSFVPTTTLTRYSRSGSFANASTNCATSGLNLAFNNGAVIDITLRIGLPQLEQGAFATSVIPTTTATATRSADVVEITGSNFSRFYRQDEGTFYTENRIGGFQTNNYPNAFSANDSTGNNVIQNYRLDYAIRYTYGVNASGAAQVSFNQSSVIAAGAVAKMATAVATNNGILVVNATAQGEDTSLTMPTGINRLQIPGGGDMTIRRLAFFPARLPNTALQRLTQ